MIKIGDFATIFGVSIKTLHFYEKKGLLKPTYVDIYSGYRYYDENNIVQMSKIMALKELGLELNEIHNLNEDLVQKKIEEYTEKINQFANHIHSLKSLSWENGEVKNLKIFINDDKAIGKWKLENVYEGMEDYPNHPCEFEVGIKELYLMPKGEEYWVISWTKGIVYISGRENKYKIENDKMFLYLVDPIDHYESKIAVYKKVDSNVYSVEDIRIRDNTNIEFIEDEKLIGFWKSVDFVCNVEEFVPGKAITCELALKQIAVSPETGEGNVIIDYGSKTFKTKYSKDYIIDLCFKDTLCKYEYKNANGKDYLIVEWKSGDYIFGGLINGYYVLEKL